MGPSSPHLPASIQRASGLAENRFLELGIFERKRVLGGSSQAFSKASLGLPTRLATAAEAREQAV